MKAKSGLRDRKKRATRHQIAEVAIRLFAERGFDEVKVADIAAASNVAEKTVYNYFAKKEDLVLDSREEIEAELLERVYTRARGESVLEAVRGHTLAVAERINALPEDRRAAFRKVVQTTPAIHERMRQMSLESEVRLARLLAAETAASPRDPIPLIVAGILGQLARLSFGVPGWPSPKRSQATTIAGINAAFDALGRGLSNYAVRSKP